MSILKIENYSDNKINYIKFNKDINNNDFVNFVCNMFNCNKIFVDVYSIDNNANLLTKINLLTKTNFTFMALSNEKLDLHLEMEISSLNDFINIINLFNFEELVIINNNLDWNTQLLLKNSFKIYAPIYYDDSFYFNFVKSNNNQIEILFSKKYNLKSIINEISDYN